MSQSILPILESMKATHEAHLRQLLDWKTAGGTLDDDPHHESIDDFINRERLAVSRFASSIAHLAKHETVPH